jgi:hypothetical protein
VTLTYQHGRKERESMKIGKPEEEKKTEKFNIEACITGKSS